MFTYVLSRYEKICFGVIEYSHLNVNSQENWGSENF